MLAITLVLKCAMIFSSAFISRIRSQLFPPVFPLSKRRKRHFSSFFREKWLYIELLSHPQSRKKRFFSERVHPSPSI